MRWYIPFVAVLPAITDVTNLANEEKDTFSNQDTKLVELLGSAKDTIIVNRGELKKESLFERDELKVISSSLFITLIKTLKLDVLYLIVNNYVNLWLLLTQMIYKNQWKRKTLTISGIIDALETFLCIVVNKYFSYNLITLKHIKLK